MNILRADIYHLATSKNFRNGIITTILTSIGFVLLFSWAIKANQLQGGMSTMNTAAWLGGKYSGIGIIYLILSVCVSIFVTSDFVSGTIKYPIAKGRSRLQMYVSKFVVSSLFALSLFVVYGLVTHLVVYFLWGMGDWNVEMMMGSFVNDFVQLMLLLAAISVFVMISMISSNGTGAVAINLIVFMFFPSLLDYLSSLSDSSINLASFWMMNHTEVLTTPLVSGSLQLQALSVAIMNLCLAAAIGILGFIRYEVK